MLFNDILEGTILKKFPGKPAQGLLKNNYGNPCGGETS